jgi:hypothetical protein
VYLQPSSLEALQARITAEFLANPPLHYEPDEAAAAAAARAAGEVAAALRAAGLFDAVITHDAEVWCWGVVLECGVGVWCWGVVLGCGVGVCLTGAVLLLPG